MSDITVGSVAVSVVPDARGFKEKMTAKLRGLAADVSLNADVVGLREKIKESTKDLPKPRVRVEASTDALTAKVKAEALAISKAVQVDIPLTADGERMRRAIADQVATINRLAKIDIPVDLEGATALRTKMAVELDVLKEMARQASPTVTVDADTAGAEAKIAAVARNRRSTINASGVTGALSGISTLGASIVALGPALIPLTAALVGLVAALAAPLAFAGGGLTLFGLIAGFAVKGTKEQIKQLGVLSKKVDVDKLALAKASTPSGKKSAALQLAADTKSYRLAFAALTPAQKRFTSAQDKLKESFHKLIVAAGGAIFGPLIKGMDLLSGILPKLAPAIRPIADGIGTLLDDIGKAAKGPGFKAFIKVFGTTARDAIVTFGRIFGNIAKGLFDLFQAFDPASKGLAGSMGKMAKGFANFDFKNSDKFQSFLAYVRDVGPKVADTFGNIFGAVGNLAGILAPLAGASLALVDAIAKFIAKADPRTLATIAAVVGGIALAFGAVNPATLIAFAGGLGFLVSKSKPLNKAFGELSGWVRDRLMPALDDAAKKVIPALQSAFDSVKQSVKDNHGLFKALGDAAKRVGNLITNVLIPAMATFYSVELPLLGKAIGLAITTVRLLALSFADMSLVAVESFKLLVTSALTTFGGILKAASVGLGWIPGIGGKIKKAQNAFDTFKDGSIKSLDKTTDSIKGVIRTLNNLEPPKPITIKVRLALDSSNRTALALLGLGGPGPSAKTRGLIAGRATGGPVMAGHPYVVGETKPELFVPETNGHIVPSVPTSGGSTGPQFSDIKVYAQDMNDFLRQMQMRSRQVGLGGVPA